MINKIITLILLGILAVACTEKINVKLDETYTRLVVDGNIANDTSPYRVTLTKSADYFFNEPMPRVTNANVVLTDGSNFYPLHETSEGETGVYETDSLFAGQLKKNYTLKIELLEEISGQSAFEASCDLRTVTHLDSIRAEFHADWGKEGFWTIKLWAQEPGDEVNFYLFNLYRNGILLTDTLNKKVISDDKFYNGSYMNGVDVVYLNNAHKWETIYPGDTIMLQMSGITEEYFNFIDQVRQAGFNIPFFSGPPANVKGNINNGGIGFFAAYSNTYAKAIVR
jgi:hypothetical protein